jgi:hypothetical protein
MTLRISSQQMDAFKADAIERYIDSVIPHLQECFPEACEELGEQDTLEMVRYGIDLADSYGIDREVCVCEFIDLMFLFGVEFDRDPDLPWASEILQDESIQKQGALMDHLWEAGIAAIENQIDQQGTVAD